MADKKEIVIVGGGIQGACTAYYLTRHPRYDPQKHSITLLEASQIATGASGKAGGLLALWSYPSSIVPLSFRLHDELAKEHNGGERWGYRRLGVGQINCKGHTISNTPKPSKSANGEAAGKDTKGLHTTSGGVAGNVDVERVSLEKRSKESHSNLRKKKVPDDLDWIDDQSIIDYDSMGGPEDTAQVHPYQFTTSIAQLAREAGTKIIERAHVTQVNLADNKAQAESVTYTNRDTSETTTLKATDIILTAGPWTKSLWPSAPISALRAHSVTLRPTDRADNVGPYALFTHISLPKNYLPFHPSRPNTVTPEIYARPDRTLYACGEGDHLVPLPQFADAVTPADDRCQDIINHVSAVSECLATAEVVGRNACYLPQNEHGGSPLIGPTKTKGVWMAAGHTCWGIQNSAATGKLMSEFVMDGEAKSANVKSLDPRRVM